MDAIQADLFLKKKNSLVWCEVSPFYWLQIQELYKWLLWLQLQMALSNMSRNRGPYWVQRVE